MKNERTLLNIINNNKNPIYRFLSKLGSSLIYAISILPFAGLILGFSVFFDQFGLENFSNILNAFSIAIFNSFFILVLLSITFKFTNYESSYSILNGLIAFIVFVIIQDFFIDLNIFLSTPYDQYFINQKGQFSYFIFSIFGAIILGLLFAIVFNKTFYKKFNNKYLNSFSGQMYSLFWMVTITVIFCLLYLFFWPIILWILFSIGRGISYLPPGLDTFFYGFFNRILLLFGLHTTLMTFFLYSPIGGVLIENGEIIAQGDTIIWITAQALDIPLQVIREGSQSGEFYYNGNYYEITKNINPGQYQQGFFPILIFGFPAAGYSMSKKVEDKNLRRTILLVSVIPMFTGITEPFEYLFIFTYPILYFLHAFFTGLSFMLLDLLDVSVWLSSGWIFDILLFGVLPQYFNNSITNYYYIFLIGIGFVPLYYYSFKYLFKANEIKF